MQTVRYREQTILYNKPVEVTQCSIPLGTSFTNDELFDAKVCYSKGRTNTGAARRETTSDTTKVRVKCTHEPNTTIPSYLALFSAFFMPDESQKLEHITKTTDDTNDKVTFQWLRQTLPVVLSFIGVMVTLGTITLRNESRLTTVEAGVSFIQLQLERVNDKLDRIQDGGGKR